MLICWPKVTNKLFISRHGSLHTHQPVYLQSKHDISNQERRKEKRTDHFFLPLQLLCLDGCLHETRWIVTLASHHDQTKAFLSLAPLFSRAQFWAPAANACCCRSCFHTVLLPAVYGHCKKETRVYIQYYNTTASAAAAVSTPFPFFFIWFLYIDNSFFGLTLNSISRTTRRNFFLHVSIT